VVITDRLHVDAPLVETNALGRRTAATTTSVLLELRHGKQGRLRLLELNHLVLKMRVAEVEDVMELLQAQLADIV